MLECEMCFASPDKAQETVCFNVNSRCIPFYSHTHTHKHKLQANITNQGSSGNPSYSLECVCVGSRGLELAPTHNRGLLASANH